MSSATIGVFSFRRALLAAALAGLCGQVAYARVPDECRRAPLSVRCVKALWRGGEAKPKRSAAAPEMGESDRRHVDTTSTVEAPYAGPPPVALAHAVRTPPLRNVPPIPPPKHGDNDERNEPGRPQRPKDVTAAPVTGHQNAMGPVQSAPAASGVSFEGIGAGFPGSTSGVLPPDVNGRVGATQYVQWNNLSFAVWDKSGKLLYGPAAGSTLFQHLGGPCATHNDGDPVVAYDILAGRWIVSQFALGASPGYSHQCIAVSASDDATGSYYLYDFVTDATNFVDYPHISVWPDGYYMSAHIFNQNISYIAGRIYVFERDKMLHGQPARQLSADLRVPQAGYPQYGFLPADLDSAMPPPPGEAEFVLGPDPVTTAKLDSARVAVTWGATPTITLTETTIDSPWSFPPCVDGGRNCVPQPSPASGSYYLDNLDQHFMYRLAYRNFGGSPVQESLVANMTVNGTGTPEHSAIRWFEFRNAGSSTATPTVYQAGTFDPDTHYRWMGSIAMDRDHNIALGYSKSSTTVKPSILINGRLATDPLNTLGSETEMQAGGGVQLHSSGRWGDYSAMTLDPIDQCTFWYTNEYMQSNGSVNWSTRIASFKFPSCSGETWGTVSGTITSCATNLPLSGVVVALSNDYTGVSDAAGQYSIRTPSGTYNATAADTARNCTTSSPATVSVIVPSNGTVSQNFCMTGGSNLAFSSVTIDDSTNGNNNGIVNRNECVKLNVAIANDGCGAESNVSATLSTTTPEVSVTQGSSPYPDLAIDANGTNSVPFRFQTSAAFLCGTPIDFTLKVTSASGTKSIPFSVATCGTSPRGIPSSSLAAGDPTQIDRLYRTGVAMVCSGGKACPGTIGSSGSYRYKAFPFTNPSPTASCVTVAVTAACGGSGQIESIAYLGSTYSPPTTVGDAKFCTNYLGDGGNSATTGTIQYSFTVPGSSSFVVVVNTVDPSDTCSQFSGTVTGLIDDVAGPGACPVCTTPATPTITAAGPTTFCSGGSVTLNSSAASGNQWYLNGAAINSATGTSYAATASGNYTVTTTANSCISAPSAATTVTVKAVPATPAASNGGPYCAGGTINLSTAAVTGATYAWTGPNSFTSSQQNPQIANATAAAAGTYSVTVTVNGCTSTAGTTNVIVNPLPPTPAASNGGPYCPGQTIALSTPAVAGAAYAWTGPNGFTSTLQNPTRTNAAGNDGGTYSVTVTAGGCTSLAGTTQVIVNGTPAASNSGPFCEGGTIALSAPTIPGATYAWTGPNNFTSTLQNPTRASATFADAGAYSVAVTLNTCTSPAGTTNVVVNPIPAAPTATNSGPFCEYGTISLATPTVAGATYSWTGPNGFTSTQQNPTRTNVALSDAGQYSVTITVNGCTSPAGTTDVVLTPAPPTPAASNGGPYCEGSTIALSTPDVPGATYSWTGPNGFTSTDRTPTRTNSTAADFGTYSVRITSNGCPSLAGTTNVVDITPATPAATNSGPFCVGGTVALATPTVAGATYAWTGPNGFTSTQQNPTIANAATSDGGTYSVTVTANGCTSAAGHTDVVVSTTPATPVATNGGPYCPGGTIALSTPAVAGVTYSWTGPNGFTSSLRTPVIANTTPAMSGSYSVTLFNGCTTAAGSTTVVVNATPATPAASNGGPYCNGGTIALSTPAVAGATYAWTGPGGFTSSLQNPTRSNATAAMAGTYSVVVTVNGCPSAAGSTNVVMNATPATPTASNGGPYCPGGTITLATPSVAGATYSWIGPNGFTSTLQNPTRANATTADAGNYSVITIVNGCPSAAGATSVVVNATPVTPTVSNSGPYCSGATVALSTPTVSGATYLWTGPNGFTSALQNPTITSASTARSGTYSVTVTVNGCPSAAGSTTVTVNALPSAPTITAGGPTAFCAGGSVTLTSSAASGNQWQLNGAPINGATGSTYVATAAGNYSVTTTANACTSTPSAAKIVTVNSLPDATISGALIVPSGPGATEFVSDAGAGATYAWTITNGTIASGNGTRSITFTAGTSGTVTVNVTVTSASGCSTSKSRSVTISPTVAAVTPSAGRTNGGANVTITGSGFQSGAAVLFGSTAATNVVRVSATTVTATAPAHVAGAVTVTVTNPDAVSGNRASAFSYVAQQFDPNNDRAIDPADIFYLVNYLFTGGPAPQGAAGMVSGDSNGDGVVDPADVFYVINFLFTGGPSPMSLPAPPGTTTSVALGDSFVRGGRTFVPVIVSNANALSLRVNARGSGHVVGIRRVGAANPVFENTPPVEGGAAWLVSYGEHGVDGVVAEIEISGDTTRLELDPVLTFVSTSEPRKASRRSAR